MLSIDRILVPVDFSEHAEVALTHAVELAHTHDAELMLLHVVEDPSFPSFYGTGAVTLYGKVPDLEERARDALETLVADLETETPSIETHVVRGRAGTAIVAFVDEHDVDLVVIASRGLSGVDRVLMGSVAEKVVRRASCPIFVIKSGTKSLVQG